MYIVHLRGDPESQMNIQKHFDPRSEGGIGQRDAFFSMSFRASVSAWLSQLEALGSQTIGCTPQFHGGSVGGWERLQTHLPTSCKSTTDATSQASVWPVSELGNRCSELTALELQQCGGIWKTKNQTRSSFKHLPQRHIDKTSHGGAEHYSMGE